ncbi:MAG TPA: hypothetical protein RMH85_03140 [Polyangiaceae bacterium LLY-WYZ-15_(1-7)]|nr:hypothetical protein [Myxococcales bacterium]MAT27466.1 hypothetical protein [Sandaracinus sp.]HJK94223.1 hypothetical protein [Polyangiaceae bacterium LLY-WYZ-15_(1-7)]MBJ73646.1 hypothetical protein [Sandaracinus sp.]HJL03373.1 hypothetical protein [Polyangiaceae bacterium LLY-WYZ-15_(1-7)]
MGGWETVLAALGGLLLGMGLGLGLGRRREAAARRRLRAHGQALRSTVIPVLEERAELVGVPEAERGDGAGDPLETATQLAASIQRHHDAQVLPYTDTVDISSEHLEEHGS